MKSMIIAIVCLAASLTTASAADAPTARDHYFEAARTADSQWVGVRTSVLLRRGAKQDTVIREVGEGADFHSGDRFRLRMQTNDDGYAYLLLEAPNGRYKLLYPTKTMKPHSNRVRAFEDRLLPGRPNEWLAFDNKPAIEGLYLVLSPRPVSQLERANGGPETVSKSDFEDLVANNGRAFSMVYDEPEDDSSGLIPATFYVERHDEGQGFLVRKLDLVHRNAPGPKDGER